MDPKELSPAYYTSLGLIILGAFLTGLSTTALAVIGWILLIPGIALNILSTLIIIQKFKGGPLTSEAPNPHPAEPEPDTETHETIHPTPTPEAPRPDEKIFRPRAPRPR